MSKGIARILALVSIVSLLGACGTISGHPEVKTVGRAGYALVQPSNVRSAYFAGGMLCPEPPPDTGLQAAIQAAAKVTTPSSLAVDTSASLNTTIVQLAGRDHTVLVARDLLSSICVLRMNGFMANPDVVNAYKSATDVIMAMAQADKANAQAAATNATANLVKAAAAAKAPVDPAIIAAALTLSQAVGSDADQIAGRFTRGDGAVITVDLVNFSKSNDVITLLGSGSAAALGKLTSKSDIIAFVDANPETADSLATLAKKF